MYFYDVAVRGVEKSHISILLTDAYGDCGWLVLSVQMLLVAYGRLRWVELIN